MKTTVPNVKTTAKSAILCVFTLIATANGFSQSVSGSNGLVFNNYTEIAKPNGSLKKGAEYRFNSVTNGVNAVVRIDTTVGGATVSKIDDNSGGLGYVSAFQPEIKIPSGTGESYVQMTFSFFKTDNVTPQVMDSISATAVDIDGNLRLKEFVEVDMAGGQASYMTSTLDISVLSMLINHFRGSNILGIERNNIDTTAWGNMYTVKKSGITQFTVKFGANTLAASNDSRQYSLYMKNFNIPNQAVLLPVKLESFTAQLNTAGNRVDLQWVTASEMNVSHFAIEKSTDGSNFTDAGLVFAYGNSTERKTYQYADNVSNSTAKIIYYRLRSVDNDGKTTYSATRVIRLGKTTDATITLLTYPNPVTNEVRVTIPATWQGKKVDYQLVNANGQLMRRVADANASQTQTIDMTTLAPGFYIVRVSCEGETAQQKVIKK